MDVIKLNKIISESHSRSEQEFNQKLRSYDFQSIMDILEYQKKNQLNNSQTALHFKISRNSITKWKRLYSK